MKKVRNVEIKSDFSRLADRPYRRVRQFLIMAAAIVLVPLSAQSAPINPADIQTYQRDQWSREVTPCDIAAAHPDDPERVATGVARAAVDLEAARIACHAAVLADPENPRLNYQLARVYGYSGRHAEGEPFRMAALKAGYPQSLFVFGFIRLTGWDGAPADPCLGGELIRLSAHAGRFAGLVGYPHYAVSGAFDGCGIQIDKTELLGFLDRADAASDDFYKDILIAQLRHRVEALED
jgi:hypothetical protein